MGKKYLPSRASKDKCFLIIGLVLGIYLLQNSPFPSLIGGQYFTYGLKPALWLGLAFLVWWFPRVRAAGKLKFSGFLNWWAFSFAFIFIVASVTAGIFLDGLGKSPYNHSLTGLIINIWLVGSMLLGMELVRSYLVNSFTDDDSYLVFVLIALLITLVGIPWSKIVGFKGLEEAVKYTAQFALPELSKNLLATYLAYLGGPIPAIIYMGTIQAFNWLSPILPDLKWITAAFVGVLCPVFSLSAMQLMYAKESKSLKGKDRDEEGPAGWMATSVFSIVLIWFVVGVFPVYPSVIATGSMEPVIKPGDIILVKKVLNMDDINDLKEGDVIQFQRDNILISHRIMEIQKEKNGDASYCTKGDNNSTADSETVKPEQIKGKIIEVVPKIGWPTLLIKSNKDIPLDEIQF